MSDDDNWYIAKTQDDGVIARLQARVKELEHERDSWMEECKKLQPGQPIWRRLASCQEELIECQQENARLAERVGELAECRAEAIDQRNKLHSENVRLREAIKGVADEWYHSNKKHMSPALGDAIEALVPRQDNCPEPHCDLIRGHTEAHEADWTSVVPASKRDVPWDSSPKCKKCGTTLPDEDPCPSQSIQETQGVAGSGLRGDHEEPKSTGNESCEVKVGGPAASPTQTETQAAAEEYVRETDYISNDNRRLAGNAFIAGAIWGRAEFSRPDTLAQALAHLEALLYADHEDAYEPALKWFKALPIEALGKPDI